MLAAGIPLTSALHSITLSSDEHLNRVAIQILTLIESGHSLSDAMSRIPGAFSPFILGIYRVNETGGHLSEGLEDLSKYLAGEERKRSQIIQALVYPLFILMSCILMVGFLILYMLPKFMNVIKDTGSQVPFLTQMLMSLTKSSVIYSILSGTAIVLILAPPFFMTPMGKIYLQKILYGIPVLNSFLLGTVLERFSRTLAMLMRTSRNVVFAIKTIGQSTTNYYALDQALEEVTQDITVNGTSLSEAMSQIDIFPKIMTSMIAAGEEVGDISDLLEKYAYMEELHTQTLLQNFFTILKPFILLVMGLVVGFIVLAAFLPIFQLVQTL
jgi:type II secretory pathway component PulF